MTEIISNKPTGKQLADDGIALAKSHAEFVTPKWGDLIMAEFETWVKRQDTRFAIENFRMHVEENRPDLLPPTPNAWGSVGRMARLRGLVKHVGYRPAMSSATRGHPVKIFVRAV